MYRFVLFVFVCVFSTNSSSQNLNIERMCNAALSSGIRDNYILMSDREMLHLYQARVCDAKFETYSSYAQNMSSSGFNLEIADSLLGLTGDSSAKNRSFTERYSSFCAADASVETYSDRFVRYTSTVSRELATNWRLCKESALNAWLSVNSYGIYLDVTPQDDFSRFSVQLTRKSPDTPAILIESITPEGAVTCFHGGKLIRFGRTRFDTNEFILTCEKHPLRSVSVAIDTSAGNSNFVLVPAQTSKIFELEQENAVLRQAIAKTRDTLEALDKRQFEYENKVSDAMSDWGSEKATTSAESDEVTRCPNGYYVSGIRKVPQGSGECKRCLVGIRFECRQLNAP
ncbi:hypothetical protein [Labrenzia sp. R5_0]|uniref:hypothetical protein n=1 Tax=Labrenzia sp. R5_0 TaxID=2821108 RepID=UPI001AD9ECF7|nr:hypothetical protein [Labrenzia sp. R5_0]MBO9462467.1 hypothetical protein [Labrenzia sp. R5_0]